ncbi:MAG: signal recognition particle-docking protein FtsY [Clostridia bacterium]|nr:signal recognition particle-docking protein FtsY [Clostridia bacterium]MBO4428497.1 signal recognition particle-docking protein FtsY [Clostridia bacterium]
MGFFEKLKNGLAKTKAALAEGINNIFKNFRRVDEDLMDELEELLITSDVGVETTMEMLDELRDRIKTDNIKDPEEVKKVLFDIIRSMIGDSEPIKTGDAMTVILVIGVNGVGKTTSIAKIANVMKRGGKKVILCAADTFRAAAADQLRVWADRVGVDIIAQSEGSDPAAVVYDAAGAAKKRGADVLIIDTAGRLHNKKNLMNELEKINRVIDRELSGCIRETLLVLDATTGQNAIIQAKEFKNAAPITGLVLTKLDGTAKGGIVISIKKELDIPVKFIGVGEKVDDLETFDPDEFVKALFE